MQLCMRNEKLYSRRSRTRILHVIKNVRQLKTFLVKCEPKCVGKKLNLPHL